MSDILPQIYRRISGLKKLRNSTTISVFGIFPINIFPIELDMDMDRATEKHLARNPAGNDWLSKFLTDEKISGDPEISTLYREMLLCDEAQKEKSMERLITALKLKYGSG
jgi:hypothetical protein